VKIRNQLLEAGLKKYPHLRQEDDFWQYGFMSREAAQELARKEIAAKD